MELFRHNKLRWMLVIILFIVPLIPLYLLELQVKPLANSFQSNTSQFQFTSKDLDPTQLENQDVEWKPFNFNKHGKMEGYYWFKYQLPENRWRDPHLYWIYIHDAEVYMDGRQMYTFHAKYKDFSQPHLIWLPEDFSNKEIYIRIGFQDQFLSPGVMIIDSKFNLILSWVLQSEYRMVLGFISLLAGIAGTTLYLGRRQLSYLYFSLFAFYVVYLCISRSWPLLGLIIPAPWIAHFQDVLLTLGGYSFLRFYGEIFGKGAYQIHRRLSQGMLVMFVPMIVTALWFPSFYYYNMTLFLQNGVSPVMMIIILISSIHIYYKRRDTETFWFMAGFATVGIFSMVYFLRPIIQPVIDLLSVPFPWFLHFENLLYRGDRFLHGIFILLFCMAMILHERIRNVYVKAKQTAEELTRLSGSLEQLVQVRTKALEQTNLNLRSSMQETAEALAEVAVLEDRNRIAQDMHDRTGHSLTAALIQIEAAKMLATKDVGLTLKKLEATRESVASGLESIRETVRMMKLDYEERALVPSMQKLIQETEHAMGIQVIYGPTALPDLNTIVKKTLYLALQEGLTNGIRHGRASRFEFSLGVREDYIYFRLANNGKNYAGQEFGFGLNTMRERIERLNGTMHVETNDVHACVLVIDLPIQPDSIKSEDDNDDTSNHS